MSAAGTVNTVLWVIIILIVVVILLVIFFKLLDHLMIAPYAYAQGTTTVVEDVSISQQIANVAFVIVGGIIGSTLLTVFPYFNQKRALEVQKEEILKKPPEQRTPEEQYILDTKPRGFWDEYKYRFSFGLLAGIGLTLAFLQPALDQIAGFTTAQAIFAGITASGFFSALADKIRSVGVSTPAEAAKPIGVVETPAAK